MLCGGPQSTCFWKQDAGHLKSVGGPQFARGPWFGRTWSSTKSSQQAADQAVRPRPGTGGGQGKRR